MNDELLAPGWLLRPESWPSRMPDYMPYFPKPNEPPGVAFAPPAMPRNLPPWLTVDLPEATNDEAAEPPSSTWQDLVNALPVAGFGRPLGLQSAAPMGQPAANLGLSPSALTPWAPLPFGPLSAPQRSPAPGIAASPMWPATPAQPATGPETPIDESAAVQDATEAAARRMRRGVQRSMAAPDASPPTAPTTEAGDPGWLERVRLNGVDSFYRGTLAGAGRLALMQHYASTSDEPGIDPQTKRWRDQLRKDYPQALADLARYDSMRGSSSAGEFAAAALGQFGGGLPTPESLVGVGAKAATLPWRLAKAGLQQGAVNVATDPAVQGLNMMAGVQDEYDPVRTATNAGLGLVTGAAARSAAEGLGLANGWKLFASIGPLTRTEQLFANRARGHAMEQQSADVLRWEGMRDVSPQITLMTPQGTRIRMDFVALDPHSAEIVCVECKGSATARLRSRQRLGHFEIEQFGATVVGAGKPAFPGGSVIPPTRVRTMRPRWSD